jgi:adenine deaminase
VLRTEEDFRDLAAAYFDRAAADSVTHAEIFFDPQTHTARGIPFGVVMKGLLAGMAEAEERHGLSSKLILCFLRHLDEADAFATLREAEPWLDRIEAVGLDSSELGHPPSKFARVFAAAAELGLKRVAHAGEEGPPEYVHEALDLLRIDRLDHGNRSLEDPALVARLAEEQMTLTVCPLSNLKLCVVGDMADHPIDRMLGAGLRATVNSDDPAYFGGYVNDNYRAVAAARGLDRDALASLARNSFLGAFLPEDEKAAQLANLDRYLAETAAPVEARPPGPHAA